MAVFNRGVPGFAVEPDGVLHTSLMRSCTGWPSGTWIDPPRRTAPDGSNFQLQHWTHAFDYAVAAGDGDWRASEMVGRSAEYGQPLIGVFTDHPAVAGGLPVVGSLLGVEPASDVALGALKATGNPIAAGSSAPVDPRSGITLRLVQTSGRPTGRINSGIRHLEEPERLDLLERPLAHDGDALMLDGYEIATVRARLDLPHVLNGDHTTLAPDAEVAQPVYARYWLHNRGPAPLGGLPAVAYVHPAEVAGQPGRPVRLRLTAASDCSDLALHGRVRMRCPDGWSAAPDELPFVLPPGEYLETEITLQIASGCRARSLPGAGGIGHHRRRQPQSDPGIVAPGGRGHLRGERRRNGRRTVETRRRTTARRRGRGGTATLSVTVGTDAGAALSLEAHLISPWGTWEWLGPSVVSAELGAGGTATLDFEVAPPAWVVPGQWWALVRIAAAGRLLYTPAVAVTVR